MVLPPTPKQMEHCMTTFQYNTTTERSLVEPEFVRESKLCKRVINQISGESIWNNNDPLQRFDLIYKWAKQNQDQFEVEMMSDITDPSDEATGEIKWTQDGLERYVQQHGFHKLKELGTRYEVTGRDKQTLIKRILEKQLKG